MDRDWVKYFEYKKGLGAVIIEGQCVAAVCDELATLRAENSRLKGEVERLRELAKRGVELHENYSWETCMCGETISMRVNHEDHQPLSMLEYYGGMWSAEAREVLATIHPPHG